MNQQTKLAVIILGLLAACGFVGAFLLYQDGRKNLQKFQSTERTLTQSIQALQEENAALRQNEQQLTDDRKALEEQRAIALEDVEQVKRELSQAKDDVSALTAQIDTLKSERDALHDQLDQLSRRQEAQDTQLAQLRRNKAALETMTADARRQLAQAREEHARLLKERDANVGHESGTPMTSAAAGGSGTVILPPIIVQPHAPPGLSAAAQAGESPAALSEPARRDQLLRRPLRLTGHVVGVNAEHRFIVIDRGASDGVGVGDRFEVSRNQHPLGALTVIRIRESIAACDATALPSSVRVRVGDDVQWMPPASY